MMENLKTNSAPITSGHLFLFMEQVITDLNRLGRLRTAETYATTLRSLKRFFHDKDVRLEDLDSDKMMAYEAYLKSCGISPNTTSFYMRNLRAVYNRAVEKNLTPPALPL